MDIEGLVWVGTRTEQFDATRRFFTDVLGMRAETDETDFAVFTVPDGSTLEVFGPTSDHNRHLAHPVAGFRVSNLADAEAELRRAGAEIVLPAQGGDERAWLHFRAPDGFVYELVEIRRRAAGVSSTAP